MQDVDIPKGENSRWKMLHERFTLEANFPKTQTCTPNR